MSKRHVFRPTAGDALEDRRVPTSLNSFFGPGALISTFNALFDIKNVPKPKVTVAALGDSYTSEYKFGGGDESHARNWVEILAAKRGNVSFGPFTDMALPAPRGQGFVANWASPGATTTDMVQTQLPGLAGQVAKGGVRFVSIFIGGNDFLDVLEGLKTGAIAPGQFPTALATVESQAAANVNIAVTTLLAANPNVKIALATLPDVGLLPIVQQEATTPQLQQAVALTSQAIQQYNTALAAIVGTNPRIALVDLSGITSELAQSASGGSFSYGGTQISLTTPGDDYHDFFLADGLHVGTVAQGIIAQAFINTINTDFNTHVPSLSPTQIVQFAKSVEHATQHGGGPR